MSYDTQEKLPDTPVESPEPRPENVEEKKITSLKEYKEWLARNFTVRLPRVQACGHRFDAGRDEPSHTNCEPCWFAFFQEHGEITQTADEVFSKFGPPGLREIRGKKFTKYFLRFMGAIAALKQQAEILQKEGIVSTQSA